ncbi:MULTISPECIES: hypothetical protein [unclassified Nocardiopsis]|uniref:hypothetical protein n=1 Tax=unclassified Nocardiopsis TaxID=2649073 RepID=UPI00135C3760|nr:MULTISPECIES: hypothetical protein [unclassified Nocardiopsis]
MSTRTDTRRTPARGRRTATGDAPPGPAAPRTRPAAAAQARAPRIPFVLLILCLLSGALVSLLVLRSVVAEEAFAITSLQAENRELSQQEQQLRRTVANLESPERIAQEAEAMGMEQGEAPLFLDPDKGEVTGSGE